MLKYWLLLIVLLIGGCCATDWSTQRAAPGHVYRFDDSEGAEITIDKFGQVFVNVNINGTSGRFVVDTASTFSSLYNTFATKIKVDDRRELHGPNSALGGIKPRVCNIDAISVGNLKLDKFYFDIVEDDALRRIERHGGLPHSDGVIGTDMLVKYGGRIDFCRMKLSFRKWKDFVANDKDLVAELLHLPRLNALAIRVRLDDMDATLLVDTGMNSLGEIESASPILQKLPMTASTPSAIYSGNKVKIEHAVALVKHFALGDLTMRNADFGVGDSSLPRSLLPASLRRLDGILGAKFFVVNGLIIDCAGGKVLRCSQSEGKPRVSR